MRQIIFPFLIYCIAFLLLHHRSSLFGEVTRRQVIVNLVYAAIAAVVTLGLMFLIVLFN